MTKVFIGVFFGFKRKFSGFFREMTWFLITFHIPCKMVKVTHSLHQLMSRNALHAYTAFVRVGCANTTSHNGIFINPYG